MPTAPLNEFTTGVLDGTGALTLKVGPLSAREIWHPKNVHVQANPTPTNEATCMMYVGDANTRRFRDRTYSGSSGDSSGKVDADTISKGEYVWAVWSGGDAGAQATLTVTGTKDI